MSNLTIAVAVSMGQLIKQAIADESKIGNASKPYVEKKMMGKNNLNIGALNPFRNSWLTVA